MHAGLRSEHCLNILRHDDFLVDQKLCYLLKLIPVGLDKLCSSLSNLIHDGFDLFVDEFGGLLALWLVESITFCIIV